jgi:hypothetical protein
VLLLASIGSGDAASVARAEEPGLARGKLLLLVLLVLLVLVDVLLEGAEMLFLALKSADELLA